MLRLMPYTLSAYGLTDIGLVRQNNEDVWGYLPEHHLYVLADGMGGHQAGEVAAREAIVFLCSHIRKFLEENQVETLNLHQIQHIISLAIEDTNHFVHEMSLSHDLLKGMGTTLCCLYFHNESVIYAHVGDSRIYRLRHHRLEQLTQDHSLLRELVDHGKIESEEKGGVLYKNIITRAIGTEVQIEPAVNVALTELGDIYLLCTDGLTDLLTKAEIENFLNQPYTVEEKVRSLIHAAKQKGGYDNITVVLVEVAEDENKNISR
ncbi:MAG: prpC-A [Chlamydiia bacterium]|nr:prpC-A [Chlamydiia bacterium]